MRQHAPRGAGAPTYEAISNPQHAVLQERVHGLETSFRSLESSVGERFSALSAQIANVGVKMEERARIPWPALGVMMSCLTVVGGLVYWPVREGQQRIIEVLDRLAATSVTKTENDLRFTSGAQRRDDAQRTTDSRIGRIEQDIIGHERVLVPRGEHEQAWLGQRQRDAEFQRQLEELRKGFSDLYSPRDALTRMQQRLDQIERLVPRPG